MIETAPAQADTPGVALVSRCFALSGLAVVVGGGLLCGGLLRDDDAQRAPCGPRAHYLYVSELELVPRTAAGERWDGVTEAPDPVVEIRWRDTLVFRSVAKQDSLVAHWSASRVGLDTLKDGSKDGVVRAARVTPKPGSGETVEFRVLDADVLFDDPVASWSVALESLTTGTTRVVTPAPGIGYVVYQLVPCDEAGAELLLR